MIKTFFSLLIIYLISNTVLFGQSESAPEYNNSNDSVKINRLFELMVEFEYSNTDTAIYFCTQALELSRKAQNSKLEAYSLYYLGCLFDIQGLFETAYNYYFMGLKIFEQLDNKNGLGGCLNCIGIVLWELSEQADNSVKRNKLTKSIEYIDKALMLYRDIDSKKGVAVCYMNKGIVYDDFAKITNDLELQKERYDIAIDNYKKAVKIFNIIGDTRSLSDCNLNIALQYYNLFYNAEDTVLTNNEYKVVNNYLNSALTQYSQCNDLYGKAMALKSLATIKIEYSKTQKHKNILLYEAIDNAKKSLAYADSVSALFLKYDAFFALFNAYKVLKKFDEALKYHELYLMTKDSVLRSEQLETMEEMEVCYNVEKKEQQIKVQKRENTRQKIIIAGVLIILVLILVLVIILIHFNRQSKTINTILNEKNNQLKQLNTTQNRLMSIISHDFKAPLSAFYSITSSLKAKYDTISKDEVDNYFGRMLNSAIALKLQLNNMLNWTINQSREMNVNISIYNLSALICKVVMVLQEFANEKSVVINNTIGNDIEMNTDGKLLGIVLNNLIANAVKFSHKNDKIDISAVKNQNGLTISVKDYGVGMSRHDMANLFVSQEKISEKENSGTGLGLIVSSDIVKKLGGKIWVEGELGKGSEFFIKFDA